ncbi:MAG: EF-Tu/IF-2/RF-3 family GTPase, partial [Balneolaceae bacterium]|nr:EF-Tu/IF-2/RF-3 family GTPase [Balneolaceae bacterium]
QKLSTGEVGVNIIHTGAGAITESDVLLASASDAIIIGFQVRPTANARKVADKEEIDIRLFSVIYDAVEEVKDAMEGLLSPEIKEELVGNAEVREIFKVSSVGTIAGCYVTDGKIVRNNPVRVVRDGVVIYDGEIDSLKRFKDDVKEVQSGYECGLSIVNYNDIKVGDVIENYAVVEEKRTLEDARNEG